MRELPKGSIPTPFTLFGRIFQIWGNIMIALLRYRSHSYVSVGCRLFALAPLKVKKVSQHNPACHVSRAEVEALT